MDVSTDDGFLFIYYTNRYRTKLNEKSTKAPGFWIGFLGYYPRAWRMKFVNGASLPLNKRAETRKRSTLERLVVRSFGLKNNSITWFVCFLRMRSLYPFMGNVVQSLLRFSSRNMCIYEKSGSKGLEGGTGHSLTYEDAPAICSIKIDVADHHIDTRENGYSEVRMRQLDRAN